MVRLSVPIPSSFLDSQQMPHISENTQREYLLVSSRSLKYLCENSVVFRLSFFKVQVSIRQSFLGTHIAWDRTFWKNVCVIQTWISMCYCIMDGYYAGRVFRPIWRKFVLHTAENFESASFGKHLFTERQIKLVHTEF